MSNPYCRIGVIKRGNTAKKLKYCWLLFVIIVFSLITLWLSRGNRVKGTIWRLIMTTLGGQQSTLKGEPIDQEVKDDNEQNKIWSGDAYLADVRLYRYDNRTTGHNLGAHSRGYVPVDEIMGECRERGKELRLLAQCRRTLRWAEAKPSQDQAQGTQMTDQSSGGNTKARSGWCQGYGSKK